MLEESGAYGLTEGVPCRYADIVQAPILGSSLSMEMDLELKFVSGVDWNWDS